MALENSSTRKLNCLIAFANPLSFPTPPTFPSKLGRKNSHPVELTDEQDVGGIFRQESTKQETATV